MPRVGQRFENYDLLERLGNGGADIVYRAQEISLGRPVALRLVPPQLAPDASTRARLNREVTLLASLDQPHVTPIYEVGEHDGTLFVATRWIDGRTLESVVGEDGPLTPSRAVRLVNQVASALEAAHGRGIAHRAVRPSSVLLTESDFVYLTDFGLARRSGDLTGLTVQEQLLDRYDYVPPEHIAGQEVDGRGDIYGLGGVLYFALTGQVPFPAENPSAKLYAHTSSPPPSPRQVNPEVPPELDEVVRRALGKTPEDRQQSAAEFAFESSSALGLSAPPWAHPKRHGVKTPASPPASPPAEAPGEPEPEAPGELRVKPDQGTGTGAAPAPGFSEPVIYGTSGRRRTRGLAWALALVLFIAAPAALLVAALH